MKKRLFVCNNAIATKEKGYTVSRLISIGNNSNVYINFDDICPPLQTALTQRLYDFLEIAAFVYSADASTIREGVWEDNNATEQWSREFKLSIPVRDFQFWEKKIVKNLLTETLSFLSNDHYVFDFQKIANDRHIQEYFSHEEGCYLPPKEVDRVLLFSGGLDSLAGALESVKSGKEVVLVSHSPVAKLSNRQADLFNMLQKKLQKKILHIPVCVNKEKRLGREYTQRTRSFLYLALAAVIAGPLNAKGISFYENGVVSLNFPVADEAIRSRASRTTHPYSLNLFQEFCKILFEREFIVDNPFIFKTKTDIVNIIKEHESSDLIKHTCSCVHTGYFQSKIHWHCGTCSQCIDRRIAIIASGLETSEEDDYVSDVFVGKRKAGYEQNMAVDYARYTNEIFLMSENDFVAKYSLELVRAGKIFPNRSKAVRAFAEMQMRHAKIAWGVIEKKVQNFIPQIINGEIEKSSMVALIIGRKHKENSWKRYAKKIFVLLNKGVPIACQTHKPKNEPHLQEICDGILKTHNLDLLREYPFMRWASRLTKPDWSSKKMNLWIEAKYVRKKSDIYKITEAMAADLIKYGDNGNYVHFITYDPSHLIVDEEEYKSDTSRRDWAISDIIR